LAEPAIVATAPAVANAVFDAIGVRPRDLPITPGDILRLLIRSSRSGSSVWR